MGFMTFESKVKFNLYKTYFDTGFALTQYLKYVLLLFGISSLNVKATLILAAGYGIGCYILGWVWLHTDFYKAQIEVSNRYNPFVEEMRDHMNHRKN